MWGSVFGDGLLDGDVANAGHVAGHTWRQELEAIGGS